MSFTSDSSLSLLFASSLCGFLLLFHILILLPPSPDGLKHQQPNQHHHPQESYRVAIDWHWRWLLQFQKFNSEEKCCPTLAFIQNSMTAGRAHSNMQWTELQNTTIIAHENEHTWNSSLNTSFPICQVWWNKQFASFPICHVTAKE